MTGNTPPYDDAQRMHPLAGLAISLVRPRTVCRRAWQKTGFRISLLYHLLGLAIFFFSLAIIDAVLWYGGIISEFDYIGPGELPIVLLFLAVWLIVIELCYFLTAWLTSCWGAGLGSFGQDFGRSICRWYQLTPFHAVWTLVFLVALHIVEEMRYDHWDYDYGTIAYQFWEMFYAGLFLLVFAVFIGGVGWLTLRALAVPRSQDVYAPKSRWPALCETCGYAIVGLTQEQTCPECGRPVATSVNTPRGSQEHGTLARMWMALFNPARLGQLLVTHTRTLGPAKALAVAALALLLTGPIGVGYVFVVTQVIIDEYWMNGFYEFVQAIIIGGLGAGLAAMVVGVTIVLAVGSLVSTVDRVFGKRNPLPAACQAACYASGYVVFLSLLMFGFTGVMILIVERYFDRMGVYWIAEVLPLVWIGLCLLLTLPYCVIVGRILRYTRFANT